MNNSPFGAPTAGAVIARIAHDVLAVGAGDEEIAAAIDSAGIRRHLQLAAGDRTIDLLQFEAPADIDSLISDCDEVSTLTAFAARLALDRREWPQFLRGLFGLAMPMLGLESDPLFLRMIDLLMDDPALPRGRLSMETIDGVATALALVPAKLRLEEKDLFVRRTGQAALLGRVSGLHRLLGAGAGDLRLAAIAFSRGTADGPCLVLTSRGPVLLDTAVRTHASAAVFAAAPSPYRQDFLSVLHLHDDDVRAELSVLRRRGARLLVVDEPLLAFRFELSAVVPLDHGVFVAGWYFDPEGRLDQVVAVDHSLVNPVLSAVWQRFEGRAEFGRGQQPVHRFVAFLPRMPGLAYADSLSLRVGLSNGEEHLAEAEPVVASLESRRRAILDQIVGHALDDQMMEQVFIAALGPVQGEINRRQGVRDRRCYGTRSTRKASLIIPLYRETGFIRAQLMAFSVDPFIRDHCDIVYVLDDPLIETEVTHRLGGAAFVHALDIRLVVLARNGGYALANNFGVAEAEGGIVVLMNSDVIPEEPGWLEMAMARLNAMPGYSVIGPKLIYADGSLQHAGMHFYRMPNGRWQNFHYWKGYGRGFEPANIERQVPAVTGACMILRKSDFEAVGGFTSDYVVGDYEDSDLCLKLRARGGTCLYMPAITLFHFERQSMPTSDSSTDAGSTVYNRALHTLRWSAPIGELAQHYKGAADVV